MQAGAILRWNAIALANGCSPWSPSQPPSLLRSSEPFDRHIEVLYCLVFALARSAWSCSMDARLLVGWNLRRLRVEKGLSQEDLGLRAGCEPSYVGRVKRGKENPTVGLLETFSNVLAIDIAELFVKLPANATRPPAMKPGRRSASPRVK